jgi:hypothetical protein
VREAFHQVLPRVTRAPGARSAAAVARLKALGDRGLALGAEWAQDRPPPATSDQSAFPLVLPLALQAAGLVWRKIENLQSYEDALLHLTSTVRDELQLGVVKR